MINARKFHEIIRAALEYAPSELEGRPEDLRAALGNGKADRAFTAMRRGVVYLLEAVIADQGLSASQKLRFVHEVSVPDLMRDPATGELYMSRLASQFARSAMEAPYAFASDAFHAGLGAESSLLNVLPDRTPAERVLAEQDIADRRVLDEAHG